MSRLPLLVVLLLAFVAVESAPAPSPFFDAIYDAINGNSRRTYGYSGYGNEYNYNTGYHSNGYREHAKPQRQGKTYKDICRVHFPDAIAQPGAGGIVCPY